MAHPARLHSLVLCLSFVVSPASALARQQPGAAPARAKQKAPASKKASAEVDPMAEVRRNAAVSLVNSLADDARMFRDPVLRARVQARSADALWEADRERAVALFRRAWDEAETVDAEQGQQRAREASRRGSPSSREAGSVRREVLRLAARRDSVLGNEFLTRFDESKKQEATASTPAATSGPATSQGQPFNPDDPPSAMTQRLALARELIRDGDTERAVTFAAPALYPVNTFGMNVLDELRRKDAATADKLYAALLPRAASDPASDANTVSLLASYVFTPLLYVTVRPDGNSHTRRFGPQTIPEGLDPKLRAAYLNVGAQILLRPVPTPDQDRTTSGRVGTYVIITRLLPLFDQFAPDKAPALRARQSLLEQDTPERSRRTDDPLFTRGIVPEDPNRDGVAEALSRLEKAKDANERDMIYFRAAMEASRKDLERAREYANKIEDTDTRRQLLAALTFQAVNEAVRGKRAEEVLRLSRSPELTDVQRAWALTEGARLLVKTDPGRAVEALDQAAEEARKIDDASPDRVRAFIAVATQLVELDRGRAWEMMNEVVKASNALPEFTGEEGSLTVRVEFKSGGAMTNNINVESFDLTGIFAALAREDFDRAANLARS
ncbi:MAG TPA: hypothetical protein VD968_15130, partial [Pyrinomonadaceae bacterium]|nr:hypothetical protein [Pyrinomonadaceae bacterium]